MEHVSQLDDLLNLEIRMSLPNVFAKLIESSPQFRSMAAIVDSASIEVLVADSRLKQMLGLHMTFQLVTS